jgi:hypothetical protein
MKNWISKSQIPVIVLILKKKYEESYSLKEDMLRPQCDIKFLHANILVKLWNIFFSMNYWVRKKDRIYTTGQAFMQIKMLKSWLEPQYRPPKFRTISRTIGQKTSNLHFSILTIPDLVNM